MKKGEILPSKQQESRCIHYIKGVLQDALHTSIFRTAAIIELVFKKKYIGKYVEPSNDIFAFRFALYAIVDNVLV